MISFNPFMQPTKSVQWQKITIIIIHFKIKTSLGRYKLADILWNTRKFSCQDCTAILYDDRMYIQQCAVSTHYNSVFSLIFLLWQRPIKDFSKWFHMHYKCQLNVLLWMILQLIKWFWILNLIVSVEVEVESQSSISGRWNTVFAQKNRWLRIFHSEKSIEWREPRHWPSRV